jgi:hypothetical protein
LSSDCTQPDCERKVRRAGYCATHYKRKRLGKDMSAPIRFMNHGMENFWLKVRKTDSCWEWTSPASGNGYGKYKHGGAMRLAHRLSYEMSHGDIPPGLQVDHTCHNLLCVNPAHLRLASNALNAQNRAGARVGSKSGVRGVHWETRENRWRASGVVDGKRSFLGYFSTVKEAEVVISAWRREHMPYSINDQRKVA